MEPDAPLFCFSMQFLTENRGDFLKQNKTSRLYHGRMNFPYLFTTNQLFRLHERLFYDLWNIKKILFLVSATLTLFRHFCFCRRCW